MPKSPASPRVVLRLYVSGKSDYTRNVLDNLERLVFEYDTNDVSVEVRDASDAYDDDHVFFTPMMVVRDRSEPQKRTVVVGDLRDREALVSVLAGYGVHPQKQPTS